MGSLSEPNRTPPPVLPFPWTSAWGEDDFGIWMAFEIKGVTQRMRWIGPGTFLMGSPETEEEHQKDELQHEVVLTRGFWLAETACTQALWEAVMGENPSRFKGADRPVERVSWDDCQSFVERANRAVPGLDLALPTEAQWEYACRAGTSTPFWFGETINPDQVNYDGNYPYGGGAKGQYREETVAVRSMPRNGWGLFEMHGNVWEWCADWHGPYDSGRVVDPRGPSEGVFRVLRGGSWLSHGRWCRSAYRSMSTPVNRNDFFGFRLARGQGE